MNKEQPPIEVFNWGMEPIKLELDSIGYEFKPVQVHMKLDGSMENKPSFCIVMHHPGADKYVYGQISMKMANDVLNQLGYQIVKYDKGDIQQR
jgi:hypothetical protein